MCKAYSNGISPDQWRKSLNSDFNFIRAWEEANEQKQIRIKNQQSLLKEMGYK